MIFLVDTSIMTENRLRPLLETCATQGHQVEVPVLVYAERLFQLRRMLGARFDPFGMREDSGPEWQDWPVGTVLRHTAALRLAEQP